MESTRHTMDFRVQMAKDVGQTVAEAVAKCSDPILEPKYNGWRCIVIRTANGVNIYKPSRNSEPSKRYNGKLPELEEQLMELLPGTILDGELVAMDYNVDECRWEEDFFRVHTCMRSTSTMPEQRRGIKLIVFDCLHTSQRDTWSWSLPRRRLEAEHAIKHLRMVELTLQLPATQEHHDELVSMGLEGSVVKDQGKPYAFGKRGHGWFKVKNVRTIDTVVMDVIMDGKGQNLGKAGRMVVGQYKDGELTRVCTVNCLNDKHRNEATANPESQIGRVLEVKIYGWDGEGPRHPTPMRFRDGDKTPAECVWSRV